MIGQAGMAESGKNYAPRLPSKDKLETLTKIGCAKEPRLRPGPLLAPVFYELEVGGSLVVLPGVVEETLIE